VEVTGVTCGDFCEEKDSCNNQHLFGSLEPGPRSLVLLEERKIDRYRKRREERGERRKR